MPGAAPERERAV